MHRTTRMLAIVMRLQGRAATLNQLAAEFECSTKTIQRDLDELLGIGVPITTNRGRHGGISIEAGWWLGPLNLSASEIETVILAMESATFLADREDVLAKVRAAVRPHRFDDIDQHALKPHIQRNASQQHTDNLASIRSVMARELWCRIDYVGGSNPGWRLVLPEHLRILENRWYLIAIDERSRETRTYRLDRIRDIQPTLAPPNASEIVDAARSVSDYHSADYPEIVVNLTDAGVRFCQDQWHLQQALEGNTLRFRCPPSEYGYYAGELIRIGTECEIVSPPELIEAVRQRLQHISNQLLK
ncbi:MAG: WYL domain-containing protein [Thermomicrobiales bacterium]|nr:WYL domain-containing protein [Thermomicrobiales bacterium]